MFYGCKSFNQNINSKLVDKNNQSKYKSWDVSNVLEMMSMFGACTNFNQNLSSWNISKSTNMEQIFRGSVRMIINGYPVSPSPDKWKNYYNPIKPLKLPDGKYRLKWNFSKNMRWKSKGLYNIKVKNGNIFFKHFNNCEYKLDQEVNYYFNQNFSVRISNYKIL